jgi:hypothetical protein
LARCFRTAQAFIEAATQHVTRIVDAISKKAHVRAKLLRELADSLVALESSKAYAAVDALKSRKAVAIAELVEGVNRGVYVKLRPLAPVGKAEQPPT